MSAPKIEIQNSAGDVAEVLIYDAIGSFDQARAFLGQLGTITAKEINLRIHSPGGAVYSGTAIYNAISRHPARIVTHIDGLAASMASIIALAGDEVRMASSAMFMIHNPWSYAVGDQHDFAKQADKLQKIKNNMVDIYRDKTGLSANKISGMLDAETWLTADEAKKLKFVDYVDNPQKDREALGNYNLSKFSNAPASLNSSAASAHAPGIDISSDFRQAREIVASLLNMSNDAREAYRRDHADEMAAAELFIRDEATPADRLAGFFKVGENGVRINTAKES